MSVLTWTWYSISELEWCSMSEADLKANLTSKWYSATDSA